MTNVQEVVNVVVSAIEPDPIEFGKVTVYVTERYKPGKDWYPIQVKIIWPSDHSNAGTLEALTFAADLTQAAAFALECERLIVAAGREVWK